MLFWIGLPFLLPQALWVRRHDPRFGAQLAQQEAVWAPSATESRG